MSHSLQMVTPDCQTRRCDSLASQKRFTLDGNEQLEARLARTCAQVLAGVKGIIPARKLEALALGGGYGRGQGGVLQTETGDEPYNDMEFYVFVRGNCLWNERAYRGKLGLLGESLSDEAGLHVEFKLGSLPQLRRAPLSMFTYDLLAGHRLLFGLQDVFRGCEHHLDPVKMPLSEATRLLFNRCSGLLLAKERLRHPAPDAEQADFIGRNLAKAQLALGDAVLAACGRYHWDCLERHQRVTQLSLAGAWQKKIEAHHAAGLKFKLHPRRTLKSAAEFHVEHQEISRLALELWLGLESLRLHRSFGNVHDYAFNGLIKCPESSFWRNCLLNLRTFGYRGVLGALAGRYPRERLLNALPLLLWNGEAEPKVRRHLQRQLQTDASDWTGLVAAYKKVWPSYG